MAEQVADFDERIICSQSGGLCPAKMKLVQTFSSEGSVSSEDVDENIDTYSDFYDEIQIATGIGRRFSVSPDMDSIKLRAKLYEYELASTKTKCAGSVEGDCPTRIRMNESKTRSRMLSVVRKVINRV